VCDWHHDISRCRCAQALRKPPQQKQNNKGPKLSLPCCCRCCRSLFSPIHRAIGRHSIPHIARAQDAAVEKKWFFHLKRDFEYATRLP
jgi:hypothetical protein